MLPLLKFRAGVMLPATMVFISIVVLGTALFAQSALHSEHQIRTHLTAVTSLSANYINPEDVAEVSDTQNTATPQYLALSRALNTVRSKVLFIEYAYIFERSDDPMQLRFVADADTLNTMQALDKNDDGVISEDETPSYPGDLYDISDTPALHLLAWSAPTTDQQFTTDQWGTFVSGYAPIINDQGQTIAVLGISSSS